MFTQKEATKEIRKTAKENGLTFKRGNGTINGNASYKFVARESGRTVLDNQSFWRAYESCQSGYIDELMGNGPKPAIIVTCEEYEICGDRMFIVKHDGVRQGSGYLGIGDLKDVLGSKRTNLVIENVARDWVW